MGHFICNKCNLVIYDAPKTGGSTIRTWIYHYLNKKKKYENYEYDSQKYLTGKKIKSRKYKLTNFVKYSKRFTKICIRRDPVERFISCYNDKIIREEKWKKIPGMKDPFDLNSFFKGIETNKKEFKWKIKLILGLDKGSWKNYLNYHFEPLTYHYGNDLNYFDEIFYLSDLDSKVKPFLENLWGIDLPTIKMRNSRLITKRYIDTLSKNDKKQIFNFYKEDYQNGWAVIPDTKK